MLQLGHQPCADRPLAAPLPCQRSSAVSLRLTAQFRGRAVAESLDRPGHYQTAQRQPFRRRSSYACSSSAGKDVEDTGYPIHTDVSQDTHQVSDQAAERSGVMPLTAKELLKDTVEILYRNFWPLIFIFALTDAAMYVLHRVSHRITNEAAIHLLGKGITAKSIGNLNFLSNNPDVANFDTGYQYLVIVFFLVVFPLNLFIRSFASTTAILYAWRKAGDPENCPDCKPTWIPPFKVMSRNLAAVWPRVRESLLRVWVVDMLVAVRVLPLQALSLPLLPLPWTLPRLLSLQLANPASVVEGVHGEEAVERSRQLSKLSGVKKALLWPYVGLIIAVRLTSVGRAPLLSLLPSRIIREIPEIPFAIYCALLFLSVVLNRMQDVLPFCVYAKAKDREFKFA